MKKFLLYAVFFIFTIQLNAQEVYYKATSNIVMLNTEKGTFDIGISHEFGNQQLQAIYNLSEKYFVFGTFNLNRGTSTSQSLFGDDITTESHNSGFSFGGGIQKLGRIGRYEHLEIVGGLEIQTVDSTEFSTNYHPEEKDYVSEKYFKLFAQFNMMKNRKNYDFGYSLKFGYLKFTDYESTSGTNFDKEHIFSLDPTLNLNFKFLPKRNLKLATQIGCSAALNSINYSETNGSTGYSSSVRVFSGILKIGLQYHFPTQKTH